MDVIAELYRAVRTIPDFPQSGIQFKDITPIFGHPDLLREAVTALAAPFREAGITRVLGIEARGFILGGMLAHALDVGFVPVRKQGKLPYKTVRETYALEHGTDAIATGGTAAAACRLAEHTGAEVIGYAFLIELSFLKGRAQLKEGIPFHAVLRY